MGVEGQGSGRAGKWKGSAVQCSAGQGKVGKWREMLRSRLKAQMRGLGMDAKIPPRGIDEGQYNQGRRRQHAKHARGNGEREGAGVVIVCSEGRDEEAHKLHECHHRQRLCTNAGEGTEGELRGSQRGAKGEPEPKYHPAFIARGRVQAGIVVMWPGGHVVMRSDGQMVQTGEPRPWRGVKKHRDAARTDEW